MSSGQGQRSGLSKTANLQNAPAAASIGQGHFPPADVSSQRRPVSNLGGGGGGGGAGGQSSKHSPSPRNNQSRKNQHKRHRRPRLADEDALAESVAMKSTTSRRGQTSITHLMNFALPARPSAHPHSHYPSHRGPRRNAPWGVRSSYYTVDKSRYVHANYRFIVNPRNNYHAQATNADVHLDWDAVLQILVSTITQDASCPICLCTPVAPRMAKCGHIFCLPCLIRYMHSTDDSNPVPEKKARWKKCPICWDSVYLAETRPVGWYTGQQADSLFEGGDVVLRLVSRRPGSTLALPRDGAENIETDEDIPWHHIADVPDYARIMKGGEGYMMSQYDAEIDALRKQEQEDELYFEEDTQWTQKAIASISDAKERVRGIGDPPDLATQASPPPRPARPPLVFEQPEDGVPDMYYIQHAAKSGHSSSNASNVQLIREQASPASSEQRDETMASPVEADGVLSTALSKATISENSSIAQDETGKGTTAAGKSLAKKQGASHPHPPDQPYYFYQALPHFYLSSLDIRILKAAFGHFSQFPSTILPRIEHISTGHIVDEDLRKRMKYLSHLPYGCEVSFLECDWTDLVSPSVLEKFSAEITRRRKRNTEKAAREEKESRRAEKEEEKRWAVTRKRRSSIPESAASVDRPFSESDFLPVGLGAAADPGPSSASPPRGHHSFAALASPSSSPPTQRTVWGTTAVAPPSSAEPAPTSAERAAAATAKDDGWLNNWEDELVAEQQEMALGGGEENGGSGGGGGGKKKKKGKKITLMSTNARRAA